MRIDLSDSYSTRINVAELLRASPLQVNYLRGAYVYVDSGYRMGCQTGSTVRRHTIIVTIVRPDVVTCDGGWRPVIQWPYIVAFERDDP